MGEEKKYKITEQIEPLGDASKSYTYTREFSTNTPSMTLEHVSIT